MSNLILKFSLPFILLFILLVLFCRALFFSHPHELPSALIGENIPTFQLPDLMQDHGFFTQDQLRGHVSLLNVWATWCSACYLEHDMLTTISTAYHIPIFGIVYKDNKTTVHAWLKKHGNPYVMIGDDANGDAAIDLGVYGTPETFVINPDGKIIYRQIGAINEEVWNNILLPLIKKYRVET